VNRRPSLPGVEELFGSGARQPAGSEPQAAASAPPADVSLAHLLPPEDEALAAARRRAGDVPAPSEEVTGLLRWVAGTAAARTAVEVGSAAGVTALALLPALPAKGVLTSIEPDGRTHGLAASAYREVGAGPRIRSIQDEPVTVLPRLADAGYDLVLLQTDAATYVDLVEHVRRLLRPGGVLVARRFAAAGEDAARAFVDALTQDEDLELAVLPLDGGLVIATLRADEGAGA